MSSVIQYVIDRLNEAATWRGLIAIATAVGVQISPDLRDSIISAGLGLIGVINVLVKDKAK